MSRNKKFEKMDIWPNVLTIWDTDILIEEWLVILLKSIIDTPLFTAYLIRKEYKYIISII